MNSIASTFNKPHHTALIAYITTGYPSLQSTMEIVPLLAEWGCDMVELGIPFSDPMADGVTIQNASFRALENGVTPDICLKTAASLKSITDIPLLFMTYYNPVYAAGLECFCNGCRDAGVSGLIIPDLPPDEGLELEKACRQGGPDIVYLLSPASTEERLTLVAERSRGFIYLVSVTGVTGTRKAVPAELAKFITRVRGIASQPLCVGFGISGADQAEEVGRTADGIIIGSRIIQLMERNDGYASLRSFITEIRCALDKRQAVSG